MSEIKFARKDIRRVGLFMVFSMIWTGMFAGGLAAQNERPPRSFAEITKSVEPAVVSIDTKGKVTQPVAKGAQPTPNDSDVLDFLRRQMQPRPVRAVGSGFIVDKTGYIMTNAHVIDDASRIIVKLDSGEEFIATVVGTDQETDLAVLKIEARRELPFIKFGDSDKAEVGDWVLAIGSPFGLAKSVTAGIISQTRRETPYASVFQKFIQTDAAINRGNSGGPLVNMNGEVVGVNSQIATSTGDYNGVGFALPSREAEFVFRQIVDNGKVRRGYMGVLLDSVKSEFASVYGLKDARGAIITDVRDKKGPAALAGLQTGDVIVEFNGQKIDSAQDLIARVAATSPEKSVSFGIIRENGANLESRTFSTRLGERPSARGSVDDQERPDPPVEGAKVDQNPFGLTLVELTPALANTYRMQSQKGLVIKEINPASFITDVKTSSGTDALVQGDLIQRINRVSVTDLKAFNTVVSKLKPGDPVVLHVLTYNPAAQVPQLKIVQFTVK
ncbi:DegQ family serine endoprotease [soil metagenome]